MARISRRGRVLGYVQARDGSLLEVPQRRWRTGKPREPRLAWFIEWTDPSMSVNGYTDEAGDAGGDDIVEIISDWDHGRHGDFQVAWLDAEESAAMAATYFGG